MQFPGHGPEGSGNRPVRTRLLGWCGGWGRKTPGYPITGRFRRARKRRKESSQIRPATQIIDLIPHNTFRITNFRKRYVTHVDDSTLRLGNFDITEPSVLMITENAMLLKSAIHILAETIILES